MAQKREKEETELKVPTPISTPPKLDPTSTSASSFFTDQAIRSAPGSDRSGPDAEIAPPPHTPTRRQQQTAAAVEAAERREVNQCSSCRRKVGLTGFRCRCGDLFCSEHRYCDRHDYSYDYKAAGREAIEQENPVGYINFHLRIEKEEEFGSPVSTLCFGLGRGTNARSRGFSSNIIKVYNSKMRTS
ncbi:hypothetical protein RHMOL_RhmolUnG0001400 [Rhododendron molle]|nr:hypothetical protein RHMOL_RhmolUnG0001400 [Rhododendron molle]